LHVVPVGQVRLYFVIGMIWLVLRVKIIVALLRFLYVQRNIPVQEMSERMSYFHIEIALSFELELTFKTNYAHWKKDLSTLILNCIILFFSKWLVGNTPVTQSHRWLIGSFFNQIMEWTDDNVFNTDITYWSPVFHLSTAIGER
jgi:hypothetical protein